MAPLPVGGYDPNDGKVGPGPHAIRINSPVPWIPGPGPRKGNARLSGHPSHPFSTVCYSGGRLSRTRLPPLPTPPPPIITLESPGSLQNLPSHRFSPGASASPGYPQRALFTLPHPRTLRLGLPPCSPSPFPEPSLCKSPAPLRALRIKGVKSSDRRGPKCTTVGSRLKQTSKSRQKRAPGEKQSHRGWPCSRRPKNAASRGEMRERWGVVMEVQKGRSCWRGPGVHSSGREMTRCRCGPERGCCHQRGTRKEGSFGGRSRLCQRRRPNASWLIFSPPLLRCH